MNIIKLNDINKIYNQGKHNELHVLSNINLEVEEGERLAIIGKSGTGKSTLLHILGCLSTPTSGSYELFGEVVDFTDQKGLAHYRNKMFGNVLQEFGLFERRNVLDNVSVPLIFNSEVKKSEIRKRCVEALSKVDRVSNLKQPTWRLSDEEKQRVAIARALVNQPRIILADEPTGSLDHHNTRVIMDIFKDLQKENITVIIATHDLDIASQCDRQIQIENEKTAFSNRGNIL